MPDDRGDTKVTDGGIGKHETHTYTTSADMTTAADIGPASTTAGKKVVLAQITLSTDTAMSIVIQSSSTLGDERHKFFLPANGSVIFVPRYPIKLPVAAEKWQAIASVSGNVAFSMVSYEET